MACYLPFRNIKLRSAITITYQRDDYSIFLGAEYVGTYHFNSHIYADFVNMETTLTEFVKTHPDHLQLISEHDEETPAYDGKCDITLSDETISNHVIYWCKHWYIDVEQLCKLCTLADKYSNVNSDVIKRVSDTLRYTNDLYVGTSHLVNVTSSTQSDYFNSISSTGSSISSYPQINMPTFRFVFGYKRTLKFGMSSIINGEFIVRRYELNVSHLDSYLLSICVFSNSAYIFSDLLNLTLPKYKHFIRMFTIFVENTFHYHINDMVGRLNNEVNRQKIQSHLINGIPNIARVTKDDEVYHYIHAKMSDFMSNIMKSLPNHLDKFPFDTACHIPVLSVYPQTKFQWVFCNIISNSNSNNLIPHGIDGKLINRDIKESTKILLPYIQVSTKLLDTYRNYTHINGLDGVSHEKPSDAFTYSEYQHAINEIIRLIADGKQIYEKYPDPINIQDIGECKMVPIHGSMVRQLQNSIFNHRLETKISLEDKLAMLAKSDVSTDVMPVPSDFTLIPELETIRIKLKSHMIHLGKILGHCIGTKTSNTKLYFRRDTVCAEINENTFEITTCLDARNKTTEASTAFKALLTDLIKQQKKSMFLATIMESTGKTEEELNENEVELECKINELFSLRVSKFSSHDKYSLGIGNNIGQVLNSLHNNIGQVGVHIGQVNGVNDGHVGIDIGEGNAIGINQRVYIDNRNMVVGTPNNTTIPSLYNARNYVNSYRENVL